MADNNKINPSITESALANMQKLERAKRETVFNETEIPTDPFVSVYTNTVRRINEAVRGNVYYDELFAEMAEGKSVVEYKKRFFLKAIDEEWISTIEACLPSLDYVIRNPERYMEEVEKVLPIELSKHISSRSVSHLCQHTNYISKVEGNKVTPSKILNVFNEETVLTYENKFINTLIQRLFTFVARRYTTVKERGCDEIHTLFNVNQEFEHDGEKTILDLNIKTIKSPQEEVVGKNYALTTDLWRRAEKLYKICMAYSESEFCKEVGSVYIRPPVMRTNAILKNKYLRECLKLWQFIETYDGGGYEMLIQETVEKLNDRYLKKYFSTLAMDYLLFCRNVRNGFRADSAVDETQVYEIKPEIVKTAAEIDKNQFNEQEEDEFIENEQPENNGISKAVKRITPKEKDYIIIIKSALKADGILSKSAKKESK